MVAARRALRIGYDVNRTCGRKEVMGVSIKTTIVAFAVLDERDPETLFNPSQGRHSTLHLRVLLELLVAGPPNWWVTLIRKPTSILVNQ